MKIQISIIELESLLNQQKILVIERLISQSHIYNEQSTESKQMPLQFDKEKFTTCGMMASEPNDVSIIKKYLPK